MLGIKYDIIIAGAGPAGSTLAYLVDHKTNLNKTPDLLQPDGKTPRYR
ncbi:hypothetical protein [Pelotomaculum sp. FP]|nr:hypothetical protein [Pelotomaculum sp. FP]